MRAPESHSIPFQHGYPNLSARFLSNRTFPAHFLLAKKDEQWDKVEGSALMPDGDVVTIGDLIYYQYATIIARSALGVPDGREGPGAGSMGSWRRGDKNCKEI